MEYWEREIVRWVILNDLEKGEWFSVVIENRERGMGERGMGGKKRNKVMKGLCCNVEYGIEKGGKSDVSDMESDNWIELNCVVLCCVVL